MNSSPVSKINLDTVVRLDAKSGTRTVTVLSASLIRRILTWRSHRPKRMQGASAPSLENLRFVPDFFFKTVYFWTTPYADPLLTFSHDHRFGSTKCKWSETWITGNFGSPHVPVLRQPSLFPLSLIPSLGETQPNKPQPYGLLLFSFGLTFIRSIYWLRSSFSLLDHDIFLQNPGWKQPFLIDMHHTLCEWFSLRTHSPSCFFSFISYSSRCLFFALVW